MKSHRLFALLCLVALLGAGLSQPAAAKSLVTDWNREMLRAIAKNPPAPTATTWRMNLVSTAMYDAWAAYDDVALSTRHGSLLRRPVAEHTDINKAAALSYAAYRALSNVFPNQEPDFREMLLSFGYPLNDSMDITTPAGIGNMAAQAVIDYRRQDGSNANNGFVQIPSAIFPELYTPTNAADPESPKAPGGAEFNANHWQPLRVPNGTLRDGDGNPIFDNDDPTTYTDQRFLTPHWGAVRTFAMTSRNQFLPPAPPQFGSDAPYVDALGNEMTNDEAWNQQFDEVLQISANLTDEQKVIAEFWADGPQTWTPPGHWNQLAEGLSIRDGHGIDEDIKMYFALNGGLLDAGIAAWNVKRVYDSIRPASAIRHKYFNQEIQAWGGPNQGTQTIMGQNWRPYQSLTFVTPAFPEYTSGHSTFSRTGREVLLGITGSDALYDGVTKLGEDFDRDGVEDFMGQHIAVPGTLLFEDGPAQTVTLRWNTMLEAADEAGLSRLYGGIHIQDGDRRAREMGRQIGQQAFAYAQALWSGEGQENADGTPCIADANTLCIGGRFEVQIRYETSLGGGQVGLGHAVPLDAMNVSRGGLFWFFNQENPEALVKVLDGCDINNRYWVFAAAATNVGYTIRVRDTRTGQEKTYSNPDLNLAVAVNDNLAFATCP